MTPTDTTNMKVAQKMSSRSHSYVQAKLSHFFCNLNRFTVFTELSLDLTNHPQLKNSEGVIKDFEPDICLYSQDLEFNLTEDAIKVADIPLLVVEILSPRQALQTLFDKFKVYFELGVQSCWLVIPHVHTISVFSTPTQEQTFSDGEVIDMVLDIHLPMAPIFKRVT